MVGKPQFWCPHPIKAPFLVQIRLCPVPVILSTMQDILASSLSKMMSSAASLSNAGWAASSSVLAGLPSVGECPWEGWWG